MSRAVFSALAYTASALPQARRDLLPTHNEKFGQLKLNPLLPCRVQAAVQFIYVLPASKSVFFSCESPFEQEISQCFCRNSRFLPRNDTTRLIPNTRIIDSMHSHQPAAEHRPDPREDTTWTSYSHRLIPTAVWRCCMLLCSGASH